MAEDQESTLSIKTASSRSSTEVIDLGNRIVKELELDRSCETLSKWLAHLLAERISAIGRVQDPDQKAELERQAIALTLEIWQQRYSVPTKVRVFGRLEKAIEFFSSIQDDTTSPVRFWSGFYEDSPWLKFARGVESFRNETLPLLVLTKVIIDAGCDPIAWEEANSDVLEAAEVEAVTLFRRWTDLVEEQISEEHDIEGSVKQSGEEKAKKAIDKLECSLTQLLDDLRQLKDAVVDSENGDK